MPYRIVNGTEEEYEALLEEGQKLFALVIHDLNTLSEKFIRTKKTFRREEDYQEICIALAIIINKQYILKEVVNEQKRNVQH